MGNATSSKGFLVYHQTVNVYDWCNKIDTTVISAEVRIKICIQCHSCTSRYSLAALAYLCPKTWICTITCSVTCPAHKRQLISSKFRHQHTHTYRRRGRHRHSSSILLRRASCATELSSTPLTSKVSRWWSVEHCRCPRGKSTCWTREQVKVCIIASLMQLHFGRVRIRDVSAKVTRQETAIANKWHVSYKTEGQLWYIALKGLNGLQRLKSHKMTFDRPYITSYERFIVIKSLSTYILCLHKHYINYNQTLVTLTFRSLSETFVRRSCSVLFLVLATVVMWRDKKLVVRVVQCISTLVPAHRTPSLLSDVHFFLNPSGTSIGLPVQDGRFWPVDYIVVMTCIISQSWFILFWQTG